MNEPFVKFEINTFTHEARARVSLFVVRRCARGAADRGRAGSDTDTEPCVSVNFELGRGASAETGHGEGPMPRTGLRD